MKKTLLMIALALVGAQVVRAQDVEIEGRPTGMTVRELTQRHLANRGSTKFSFSMQKMIEPETGLELGKADLGASISRSRTFVLHRRPLAGMIYLGLDATWIDINYAQYKSLLESDGLTMHQADFTVLGIGPSVNVFPIGKLGIHAYAKYNPTFASYFSTSDGFNMAGGYSSAITAGGAVSWGFISLGAETRVGTGKYRQLFGGDEDVDVGTVKLKTSGMRVYLSFRY